MKMQKFLAACFLVTACVSSASAMDFLSLKQKLNQQLAKQAPVTSDQLANVFEDTPNGLCLKDEFSLVATFEHTAQSVDSQKLDAAQDVFNKAKIALQDAITNNKNQQNPPIAIKPLEETVTQATQLLKTETDNRDKAVNLAVANKSKELKVELEQYYNTFSNLSSLVQGYTLGDFTTIFLDPIVNGDNLSENHCNLIKSVLFLLPKDKDEVGYYECALNYNKTQQTIKQLKKEQELKADQEKAQSDLQTKILACVANGDVEKLETICAQNPHAKEYLASLFQNQQQQQQINNSNNQQQQQQQQQQQKKTTHALPQVTKEELGDGFSYTIDKGGDIKISDRKGLVVMHGQSITQEMLTKDVRFKTINLLLLSSSKIPTKKK